MSTININSSDTTEKVYEYTDSIDEVQIESCKWWVKKCNSSEAFLTRYNAWKLKCCFYFVNSYTDFGD